MCINQVEKEDKTIYTDRGTSMHSACDCNAMMESPDLCMMACTEEDSDEILESGFEEIFTSNAQ